MEEEEEEEGAALSADPAMPRRCIFTLIASLISAIWLPPLELPCLRSQS